MIGLINGKEGDSLLVFKTADETILINCLSDLGVPLDITADTVDLAFYDTEDRRNAVSLTLATATITTALAGRATRTVLDTEMTLTPGSYFLFVKRTENVSSTVEFSRKPTRVTVR